jgi:hypothetical protein
MLNILTYCVAQQYLPICGFGCGKHATVECLVCKCALCTECCAGRSLDHITFFSPSTSCPFTYFTFLFRSYPQLELHSKPAFKNHEIGGLGELDRRKSPLCISHNKELSMFCTVCKGMVIPNFIYTISFLMRIIGLRTMCDGGRYSQSTLLYIYGGIC